MQLITFFASGCQQKRVPPCNLRAHLALAGSAQERAETDGLLRLRLRPQGQGPRVRQPLPLQPRHRTRARPGGAHSPVHGGRKHDLGNVQ